MKDFNQYVGIPWECGKMTKNSADCWGLVLMVLEEQFGIIINHMRDIAIVDTDDVSDVMVSSRYLPEWAPTESPTAGNVCMMFVKKNGVVRPEHVGIVIDDRHVLHSISCDGGVSSIHKIRTIKRIFNRLEFFSYASDNRL